MASFNRVILLGNLTRDPEVKYTQTGTPVCTVGLAVNHRWTDKSGEKREEVTFVDVDLWGRTAEIAGEYLGKGRPVLIEGRLKLEQWVDRNDGTKRSRLKVVGESMQLLGSGKQASPAADDAAGAVKDQRPAGDDWAPPVDVDDLPF